MLLPKEELEKLAIINPEIAEVNKHPNPKIDNAATDTRLVCGQEPTTTSFV